LFEEPFYRLCSARLTDNGLISAQTESLHFDRDIVGSVYRALSNIFPYVEWVIASLAMYPGNWWTFSISSKSLDPTTPRNQFSPPTEYYLREIHNWYFMPRALRDRLLEKPTVGKKRN
jgi:spermidine synthase